MSERFVGDGRLRLSGRNDARCTGCHGIRRTRATQRAVIGIMWRWAGLPSTSQQIPIRPCGDRPPGSFSPMSEASRAKVWVAARRAKTR